jgi:hypothetical protein
MIARISKELTDLAQAGAIRPHVVVNEFGDLPRVLSELSERRTTGKVVLAFKSGDKSA